MTEPSPAVPAFDESAPDPWKVHHFDPTVGGPNYGELLGAMRDLQDRFVSALPPADDVLQMTASLQALADRFAEWEAGEYRTPAGMRNDLPGRGSPLLVPVIIDEHDSHSMRGRVTFTRFHLGGNGAAHGGTLPLMFDDIVGRLVNEAGRSVARTAYLTVNYRRITRIGVEHRVEATVDRIEGRKRWATGRLFAGDDLVADAEGLFIELRPGQP